VRIRFCATFGDVTAAGWCPFLFRTPEVCSLGASVRVSPRKQSSSRAKEANAFPSPQSFTVCSRPLAAQVCSLRAGRSPFGGPQCARQFASLTHNFYRRLEPTLEMVPSQGRTKDPSPGGLKSICPPSSKWPVAGEAKRPVPPVTSAVS
jgi:hypothetical protein